MAVPVREELTPLEDFAEHGPEHGLVGVVGEGPAGEEKTSMTTPYVAGKPEGPVGVDGADVGEGLPQFAFHVLADTPEAEEFEGLPVVRAACEIEDPEFCCRCTGGPRWS